MGCAFRTLSTTVVSTVSMFTAAMTATCLRPMTQDVSTRYDTRKIHAYRTYRDLDHIQVDDMDYIKCVVVGM